MQLLTEIVQIVLILVTLTSIGLTTLIWARARKYLHIIEVWEPKVKAYATLLSNERWAKTERIKLTRDQKQARSLLAKQIRQKAPFGVLDKHNDDQIIALLLDQELMRGAIVLGEGVSTTVSGLWTFLSGKFDNEKKPQSPQSRARETMSSFNQ